MEPEELQPRKKGAAGRRKAPRIMARAGRNRFEQALTLMGRTSSPLDDRAWFRRAGAAAAQ
jgi:hypothetical protein